MNANTGRQQKLRSSRRRLPTRNGIAVVELAICLPILVLILLATIEACAMLHLKQNVTVTAAEGARVGVIPGTGAGTVSAQCQMLLDDRGITGYSVTMSPSDPSTMSPGDMFTVTVSADCVANSLLGGVFYEGKTISESVVMRAE